MKKWKLFICTAVSASMLFCVPVSAEESVTVQISEETSVEGTEADLKETMPETGGESSNDQTESIEMESAETESMMSSEPETENEEEELITEETVENELLEASGVEGFVERLYTRILGRQADTAGLKAWADVLKSGKEQGAKVAQGFIESEEFRNRSLSNDAYLRILYKTFLNRKPDRGGMDAWMSEMNAGLSRMHIFRGFAESPEFTEICQNFGITRGSVQIREARDENAGITKFIVRCYRLCLEREPDAGGLNSWCEAILNGSETAKGAAYGFVFSNEFKARNLSDSEYIRILYRVFMDREADDSGLNSWLKVIDNGKSLFHVFNGFADSREFAGICASFGIDPGPSLGAKEVFDFNYFANAYREAGRFYWEWFIDSAHIDETDWITGTYTTMYETYDEWPYYAVDYEGIHSVADLRALAHQHFNNSAIDEMIKNKDFIERNGKLYISGAEELGGGFSAIVFLGWKKLSDGDCEFYIVEEPEGTYYGYTTVLHYRYENGEWGFDTPFLDSSTEIHDLVERN